MNFKDIDDLCNLEEPENKEKEVPLDKSNKMKNSLVNSKEIKNYIAGKNLVEIIQELYNKITVYEQEMKSLVQEKKSLQSQVLTFQAQIYQYESKSKKKDKKNLVSSYDSQKSNRSEEISRQYAQEINGLKTELNHFSKQLEKQRELINENNSLLDESLEKEEKETNFSEHKENLIELKKQKEKMLNEINNLKNEIYTLMALQKEDKRKDDSSVAENENDMSNIPPIDYFFKLNGKIILVDTDKNLWHLKRCKEYDTFSKENKNKYNTKEEMFDAFIDYYQQIDAQNNNQENNVEENVLENPEQESYIDLENMISIDKNVIYANENQEDEEKQDEKYILKNKMKKEEEAKDKDESLNISANSDN